MHSQRARNVYVYQPPVYGNDRVENAPILHCGPWVVHRDVDRAFNVLGMAIAG